MALAWLIFLLPALAASSPMPPPSVAYGTLYGAVEMAGLFPDQKNFADAIADEPAAAIASDYARAKDGPGFSLRAFVARHFTLLKLRASNPPHTHQPVGDYIREMWRVLRRPPDVAEPNSSLLPLSHPYIVPGGRFTEIYY
ncbi:MAG TPA: trehalase family glycosidase, partial [Rhizomicrobium sp.]|nr:trehalase family glycosidase [Rhizomicrobium sp.]